MTQVSVQQLAPFSLVKRLFGTVYKLQEDLDTPLAVDSEIQIWNN
jgi:hypothetical protein